MNQSWIQPITMKGSSQLFFLTQLVFCVGLLNLAGLIYMYRLPYNQVIWHKAKLHEGHLEAMFHMFCT